MLSMNFILYTGHLLLHFTQMCYVYFLQSVDSMQAAAIKGYGHTDCFSDILSTHLTGSVWFYRHIKYRLEEQKAKLGQR